MSAFDDGKSPFFNGDPDFSKSGFAGEESRFAVSAGEAAGSETGPAVRTGGHAFEKGGLDFSYSGLAGERSRPAFTEA